jgi:hypothetical protein
VLENKPVFRTIALKPELPFIRRELWQRCGHKKEEKM